MTRGPAPRRRSGKGRRMLGVGLGAVGVLLACVLATLVALSPGRLRPVLDAGGAPVPGSLAQKIRVEINGVPQGMILRSADPANPVLLYLHGGPGMPTYFLDRSRPTGLERAFTVVWWDQRGAGLSFRPDIPDGTMTVRQMVADTVAVADYLRQRFGQDKIYLMGHSWGSIIGLQAAAAAPDRFHAYVGVAQLTRQVESERLARLALLAEARARGEARLARRIEAAPVGTAPPLSPEWMAVRDTAMHALGGGTTRDMRSVITGVFLPVWLDPEYTLSEKLAIWRGKWSAASGRLWNEMLAADIPAALPELAVPVYLFHGRHDLAVSGTLARSYLATLRAPRKGFYSFAESAHSPIFEEPERSLEILTGDVLRGRTDLADADPP